MDMDDDFMGEIEFDPSERQQETIRRAIEVASSSDDEFARVNPLIAIMQWWEVNGTSCDRALETPEAKLAEACRQYLLFYRGADSRSGANRS